MSTNNGFDDETPTEGIALGHLDNRELLTFLGNDILLLKAHTKMIATVYDAIRSLTVPVPIQLKARIVDGYEHNLADNAANLASLKAVVGG